MNNDDRGRDDENFGSEAVDLSQFEEDFAKAEVEGQDFEPIPDGKYKVRVERVVLTRARISGNPLLKWKLQILTSGFEGRILWRNHLFTSPEAIKWLKTDLRVCGLDLERLRDLPANLHKLQDIELEIGKRTKGDHENIFFNRILL